MKKILSTIVLAAAVTLNANAQQSDNMFNHLSIGVNAATTGVGIDAAMPCTDYVSFRAGFTFMPKIKVNTDLDINELMPSNVQKSEDYNLPDNVKVEGKTNLFNVHFLADVYPFRKSSFHLTAGLYLGTSDVVRFNNKEDGALMGITKANKDIDAHNADPAKVAVTGHINNIGLQLGDYLLTPDKDGNVAGAVRTQSIKPYVGIGLGRAVPKKTVGFQADLGCMFWGSPKVTCNNHPITAEDVSGDGGSIIKTVSKISVYPVLNFRLCFRAF